MANRPLVSLEQNFVGGLKTEFSALNFPENACIDADNSVFSILGTVDRRGGFNFETNYQLNTIASPSSVAINDYKWNNVGGDGTTQIIAQQVGGTLYFYLVSSATTTNPLSHQLLASTVNISSFVASGGSFDPTIEVTYADGNGYLFIFHPNCDPFYCTYNSSGQIITASVITLQVRDFLGLNDGLDKNTRPITLSPEHNYNLINQGWSGGWTATSNSTNTVANAGTSTFQLTGSFASLPIAVGQLLSANGNFKGATGTQNGTVFSWDPGTGILVLTNAATGNISVGIQFSIWTITSFPAYINQWFAALANYPANSDVWWYYRNTNVTTAAPDGMFNPNLAKTGYIIPTTSQAPQGAVILNPFIQLRSTVSSVQGLTDIITTARPSNGAFFDGRVFYTGVNASQQATGDAAYTTWTENIYFSQIITSPQQFGHCYQQNDPTSSTFFDLLPDDGGVIVIQGTGAIYKLFPLKFGLLVFAANGIWFISGSSGIGFSATDYAITKISNVQSISGTSVVNVLGWPVFWNEEGIYEVKPNKEGGSARSPDIALDVNNLCLGTILSFYNEIPLQSKKYARGDYNPITFVIQWLYRSTDESGIANRYQFDRALNINTYKAPFYPYSFTVNDSVIPYVTSVRYVAGPGGSTSPDPMFKYLTVYGSKFTYSEENDFTNWLDWNAVTSTDYTSTFTTGYKIHGQAQRQFGIEYIYVYSTNDANTQYSIQSLWDFATSGNSGKWSGPQVIINNLPNFGNVFRRIRLRGHGVAVQFKFTSITGQPFNFIGWSVLENQSGSV